MNKTALGIELGSTRIKAVLIDESHSPIATGSFTWENDLVDGVWTYDFEEIEGFETFAAQYKNSLPVEQAAVATL